MSRKKPIVSKDNDETNLRPKSVHLSALMWEELEKVAEETGLSLGAVIRRYIRAGLDHDKSI